jgi:hypothetical protein
MSKVFSSLLLAVTLATGCASSLTTIPVKGKDTEVFRMRGEWLGEYTNDAAGRTGALRFNLRAGRQTADGEITMKLASGESRTLKVAYLKVDGDQLHGKVDQYMDPDCKCTVEAEFSGTVEGDSVDGTFTVKLVASGQELPGSWHAERNPQ